MWKKVKRDPRREVDLHGSREEDRRGEYGAFYSSYTGMQGAWIPSRKLTMDIEFDYADLLHRRA